MNERITNSDKTEMSNATGRAPSMVGGALLRAAVIVKEYVAKAGLDSKNYSGHSLRAGLITSAAKAGASS